MRFLSLLKENVLSEVFDNPYSFNITQMNSGDMEGEVVYSFTDKDESLYNVYFDSTLLSSGWKTNVSYETGESLAMTNKYDIKVLSTVVAIVTDYLKKFQPESMEYEGVKEKEEEESPEEVSKRGKVYKAMIEKLKGAFPEYSVSFDGSNGVFTRTKPRVPPAKGADYNKNIKYFRHFDTIFK
jgi:hypothetical protein